MIYAFSTMGTVATLTPPRCANDVEGVFERYPASLKAFAMEEAGILLGADEPWVLNVGGDVLATDLDAPVYIPDPFNRSRLVAAIQLDGDRRAVATARSSEAGGSPHSDFIQVTVVANDIVTANLEASAILAGGRHTSDWCRSNLDIDFVAVDQFGELTVTPALEVAVAREVAAA